MGQARLLVLIPCKKNLNTKGTLAMVEKVDLDDTDGIHASRSTSPNKLVLDQANQMEQNGMFNEESSEVGTAGYSGETFLESMNSLFKSLLAPKDPSTRSKFFHSTDKPSYYQLTEFYSYKTVLTLIYLVMSLLRAIEYLGNRVKLRFLQLAYNPAGDPETINNDVNKLSKIPKRISAVLTYKSEQEESGGVDGLCEDTAKVTSWCLSAGIRELSIYEYHGVLKKQIPALRRSVYRKLVAYFGSENVPSFVIRIPHLDKNYDGCIDGKLIEGELPLGVVEPEAYDVEISLLSVVDGRPTIVELTKVMAELAKKGALQPADITVKFMDQELSQLVGKEPDLVILFQPYLNLQGYPPWQIRLSELYWEPDNDSTCYAVFLRALQKYSTCKINVGK